MVQESKSSKANLYIISFKINVNIIWKYFNFETFPYGNYQVGGKIWNNLI